MTHAVSLLFWLSAGLYDVLMLGPTGSTKTLLPALLVDESTVLSSKQDSYSAVALLRVWLVQFVDNWSHFLSLSLSLTQVARLGYGNLGLPPPTQQGLAEPLLQDLLPPTQQGFAELLLQDLHSPLAMMTYILLSRLVSWSLYISEPRSHTPERPSTVASLAGLVIAG